MKINLYFHFYLHVFIYITRLKHLWQMCGSVYIPFVSEMTFGRKQFNTLHFILKDQAIETSRINNIFAAMEEYLERKNWV